MLLGENSGNRYLHNGPHVKTASRPLSVTENNEAVVFGNRQVGREMQE
jgi:hypothetical protein